ncbi:predicted protein [Botrytis cinerea T4]|uniref:Uncharacterized protein n=1 Tax=Botryotinia fuckeliana (strain T4) TaxID=999810 RepID=G2YUC0_BOTF4|nr:predicted protein [Botrytis cinerea T4]
MYGMKDSDFHDSSSRHLPWCTLGDWYSKPKGPLDSSPSGSFTPVLWVCK